MARQKNAFGIEDNSLDRKSGYDPSVRAKVKRARIKAMEDARAMELWARNNFRSTPGGNANITARVKKDEEE